MKVMKQSSITGKQNTMELPITQERFDAWVNSDNRPFVQIAFPDLTDEQREFLMTGITPEEWDEIMPEDFDDGKGESRPDAEVINEEALVDPKKYTDDDNDDWHGKGTGV